MTGTLLVRADGTSCEASMVKRSVEFPSEAPRCQRISSITPQITFDQARSAGFLRALWRQDLFALKTKAALICVRLDDAAAEAIRGEEIAMNSDAAGG
jgi:hypothetical protein